MKLDKSHLNQFENISPIMQEAITLPVTGTSTDGVVVYVCVSPSSELAQRPLSVREAAVLRVAKVIQI